MDGWYDFGHFRMHDGESLPHYLLDWLLEGYRSVAPLAGNDAERISFTSLLIAVRALAHTLGKRPWRVRGHQALVSIPRDLAVLQR